MFSKLSNVESGDRTRCQLGDNVLPKVGPSHAGHLSLPVCVLSGERC